MRDVSMSPMCAFVALWIAACVLINVGSADSQGTAQLVSRKTLDHHDYPRLLRQLLDSAEVAASAAASITTVNNASHFQDALAAQVQDIEIRDHLDLSGLRLVPGFNNAHRPAALGSINGTRSIRGNCTTPPPPLATLGLEGPDLQWQSPQCVIVTDHTSFHFYGKIWLENLYIRAKPSAYFYFMFLVAQQGSEVYGSGVTLQGDGNYNTTAVWTKEGARVYIEDSLFTDVGGDGLSVLADQASVVLNRTTIVNAVQRPLEFNFHPLASGGPHAGQYVLNGLIVANGSDAAVLVQDAELQNVTAVNIFTLEESGVIAVEGNTGAPSTGYSPTSRSDEALPPLVPLPSGGVPVLGPSDEWWATVRESLADADASSYTPPQEQLPSALPALPPPPVDGAAPAQIAAVYTAADFQRAFHAGVRDIELRAHMDMRPLSDVASTVLGVTRNDRLGGVKPTTRSIRGNCTTAPPAALDPERLGTVLTPEPWRAPRCLIIVTDSPFVIDEAHLWVDSVHVQILLDRELDPRAALMFPDGALFMTDSVVQGSDNVGGTALSAFGAKRGAYFNGCVFNSLKGERSNLAAVNVWHSPASFANCTFRALSEPTPPGPLESGELVYGAINVAGLNATLALQNCTLESIRSSFAVSVQSTDVFTDNTTLTAVESLKREVIPGQPLTSLANRPLRATPPLQESDPWFVTLKQTLAAPARSAYLTDDYPLVDPIASPATGGTPSEVDSPADSTVAPPDGLTTSEPAEVAPDSGTGGSDGLGTGAVVGIVAAAVALVAAAIVIAVIVAKKNRKRKSASTGPMHGPGAAEDAKFGKPREGLQSPFPGSGPPPSGVGFGGPQGPPWLPAIPLDAPMLSSETSAGTEGRKPASMGAVERVTATESTDAFTQMTWSDFKTAGQGMTSPSAALEVALDAMCSMQAPFYHRYELFSAVERRGGGQGMVQFAKILNTSEQAAIKFYLDRKGFERERELYTESELQAMMPATLAVEDNASGDCKTPYGYVFPPFVIIERGESLDEWSRDNVNTDFITIFQVLLHAVRALRRLHGFGYAHRDIKPGNILRRPKQHDWTLIDFGCTTKIGSPASLSYSLKYAAPEVVHEIEAKSKTILVDAAVDIWAIGVIAFELLTGERAFSIHNMDAIESEQAAQEAIAGRAPLPWEGTSEETQQQLEKLRGLRRTVLLCLERDPAKRPTAPVLMKTWDHVFDRMETHGTTWIS